MEGGTVKPPKKRTGAHWSPERRAVQAAVARDMPRSEDGRNFAASTPIKSFEERDVWEARDHAQAGGQALHCHFQLGARPPACFSRDVKKGIAIGHLLDQDKGRLEDTARRLGVRIIVVERIGQPLQHIDLCGAPMRRALVECGTTQGDLFS